jgi:type VI secretion system protein
MREISLRYTTVSQNDFPRALYSISSRNIGMFHIAILSLFFLFLAMILVSCGIGVRTKAVLGDKLNVKVDISQNANTNSPIALDVILVYDEALLKQLIKMPSREWFEKREQITRDHIKGDGLDYWAWEFVPGQNVETQILPLKPKAKGGIVFANYFTPGEHRFRIDPFKDFIIHLNEKLFTVELAK